MTQLLVGTPRLVDGLGKWHLTAVSWARTTARRNVSVAHSAVVGLGSVLSKGSTISIDTKSNHVSVV